MPDAARKVIRQPHRSPRKAPSGAANTVANEMPMRMIEMAFGTLSGGTRRRASAVIMAQKLPRAKPSRPRAISRSVTLEAQAQRMLESKIGRAACRGRVRREERGGALQEATGRRD